MTPYMAPAWESETNYEMHYKWIYNESSCQEISANLI